MEDGRRQLYVDIFTEFAIENHEQDLEEILLNPDDKKHYSVKISALHLLNSYLEVHEPLLRDSLKLIACFDEALVRAAQSVYDKSRATDEMVMKPHVHARISRLPICEEICRNAVPKCEDVGAFLSVSGTIVSASRVKVLAAEKEFACSKCKFTFTSKVDLGLFYALAKLASCPSPDGCSSSKFLPTESPDSTVWMDFQEVRLQERVQSLSFRTSPRSIWVLLKDDLVDCCKPGDDVVVTGTVILRWKPVVPSVRTEKELAIVANNIRVTNDLGTEIVVTQEVRKEFQEFWQKHERSPLTGRNEILTHFCPQIYGLFRVKLAVALVLIGGVSKIDASGTKFRGESHMLLVGDPGTGKSQFLKYATKLFPRSVLTTGIGSTSAGLTVSAVKDGGEWHLEAGALVLADGGICCIDEFSSIKSMDRACILEAMEQQTISVAKAGIVCKLNSKTTILAATNPKRTYDPSLPVGENLSLSTPLLSRFDLILVLLDTKDEAWDRMICEYLLNDVEPPYKADSRNSNSAKWTMEKFQCYFSIAKGLTPSMTDDAHRILKDYYLYQRKLADEVKTRVTVRLLESLIRLSEAHAKFMFRTAVTILDAIVAVSIMEISIQSMSLLNVEMLHTTFPEDPEKDYRNQAETILKMLHLEDILDKELRRLATNSQGSQMRDVSLL